MTRSVPRPTPIEMMASLLLGPDGAAEPLPPARSAGVHGALERVLASALARPPCVVSFSGGRDSSAVLALATDVARRRGLPLPVPAIMRFPGVPTSDETDWQELVLDHLHLGNAEVLHLTDELDALGPAATEALGRHGLRWPGNAFMHRPLIEVARGGTLLTGAGGDELLSTRSAPRSWRGLAVAALPPRLREELWLRYRPRRGHGWLTPAGLTSVRRAVVRDEVRWPHRWDRAVHHWHGSRAFAALDGCIALLADAHDVKVLNPFLGREVLAEFAGAGGARGFPSRTAAMRHLCGILLPDAILSRPTKASFGGAMWGPAMRAFVRSWNGEGLDPRYVDVELLGGEWRSAEPDFRTILLLHQAWLHAHGASAATS